MSYEAWRTTFQDSEQAARTAYNIFNMSITCLAELYEALGVGGVNETFQHCEALKAIEELKASIQKGKPSTSLAVRDALQQRCGIINACDHVLSMGSSTHKAFFARDAYMYISTRALKEYADTLRDKTEATPCPPR